MAKGKTIRIDENAHRILINIKEEMKEEGIGSPTLSDSIRWLNRKVEENSHQDE